MGINQSKGSVDITSTPNKGKVADDIVKPETNGKTIDEKIITDEKPKVITYTYFWKKRIERSGAHMHDIPYFGSKSCNHTCTVLE